MKPRLDHIGIAVSSIDDALELYRDALGIEPGPRIAVAHEQVEVAMLPIGETRLELVEPTSADSSVARFLAGRGPGLHHVALEVEDLDAAVSRLRSRDARLVSERIQVGAEGRRYVFVHPKSASGALLELVEKRP